MSTKRTKKKIPPKKRNPTHKKIHTTSLGTYILLGFFKLRHKGATMSNHIFAQVYARPPEEAMRSFQARLQQLEEQITRLLPLLGEERHHDEGKVKFKVFGKEIWIDKLPHAKGLTMEQKMDRVAKKAAELRSYDIDATNTNLRKLGIGAETVDMFICYNTTGKLPVEERKSIKERKKQKPLEEAHKQQKKRKCVVLVTKEIEFIPETQPNNEPDG